MKKHNLQNFTKGWFVGNFEPSLMKTDAMEVSVKRYRAGDREESHYHKIASEWTCVIEGKISMNGEIFVTDEIVETSAFEVVSFQALEDSVTVVVKSPSVTGDKYVT